MLLRVLRKMKAVHGDVYGFHPDGYLLPTEYTKFIDAFTRLQPVSAGMWRQKTISCFARARVIFLFSRDVSLEATNSSLLRFLVYISVERWARVLVGKFLYLGYLG